LPGLNGGGAAAAVPPIYILEDLHHLGGKNVLNMCDVFEDDYTILQLPELAMYMWL